jgi:hypothetical protein
MPLDFPMAGGYFAGYISHTANGNPTHALIVAPRATGATGTGYTLTTTSSGRLPTLLPPALPATLTVQPTLPRWSLQALPDHPAANFCVGLSIGGFTDWYLPARYELDIAYFNLKPSTNANNTSWGTNIYAVPQRNINWTATYPAQTALTAFNTTAEAFVADVNHWSSSESNASTGWSVNFSRRLPKQPQQDERPPRSCLPPHRAVMHGICINRYSHNYDKS